MVQFPHVTLLYLSHDFRNTAELPHGEKTHQNGRQPQSPFLYLWLLYIFFAFISAPGPPYDVKVVAYASNDKETRSARITWMVNI